MTYAQVTPDDLGQEAKRCLNHTEATIVNPHSILEKHDGALDVNSSNGTLERSHLRSTVDVDEDSGLWVRDSLDQSGELLRVSMCQERVRECHAGLSSQFIEHEGALMITDGSPLTVDWGHGARNRHIRR